MVLLPEGDHGNYLRVTMVLLPEGDHGIITSERKGWKGT